MFDMDGGVVWPQKCTICSQVSGSYVIMHLQSLIFDFGDVADSHGHSQFLIFCALGPASFLFAVILHCFTGIVSDSDSDSATHSQLSFEQLCPSPHLEMGWG